jgi:tRNA(fMet)-specific endonuclease VapC
VIVLDTQHVSQLQRTGSRDAVALETKLQVVPPANARITVITPYEQFRTCLGLIHSGKEPDEQVSHFSLFHRLLDYYATQWQGRILPFDTDAATIFQGFSPALLRRIGSRDAKIAAIALAHGGTLLSANLSHFQQVPGLRVEDWLRD